MPKPNPRLQFRLFGILSSEAEGPLGIAALVIVVVFALLLLAFIRLTT